MAVRYPVPLLTEKQEKAIYDAFWAVKFTQGRWIAFVRTRLTDGRPCFTTFSDNAKVAALALNVKPEESPIGGAVRLRFAGWNVYQELVTKLNEDNWRCIVIDAPVILVSPPRSAPAKKKGVTK